MSVVEKSLLTKRSISTTTLFCLITALAGWWSMNDPLWAAAILFGLVISILNFWFLTLFIKALLTDGRRFDYKTMALLMLKFLILFGGLGVGLLVFKLQFLPLILGFMAILSVLLLDVLLKVGSYKVSL